MYEFGTIVLIPFPFTDLTATKLRPALIISKTNLSNQDIVVSFITGQTALSNSDGCFLLRSIDPHFKQTGLKINSVFRFDKIATLHKNLILGELGSLHKDTLNSMKEHFFEVFGFTEINK